MEGNGEVMMDGVTLRSDAAPARPTVRSARADAAEPGPSEDSRALRERLIETAVQVIAEGGYPRLGGSASSEISAR